MPWHKTVGMLAICHVRHQVRYEGLLMMVCNTQHLQRTEALLDVERIPPAVELVRAGRNGQFLQR